jgi:histone H3/H4
VSTAKRAFQQQKVLRNLSYPVMATRRQSNRKSGSDVAADRPIVESPIGSLPSQLSAHTEESRVTPRNSIGDGAVDTADKETPYANIRKLTNLLSRPTTPVQRASSAGPTPTSKISRRTPIEPNRTPAGINRPGSNRRPAAATPHAQAAMREIELRRTAALTPGNPRRHSLRQQRETPRDLLRALSRVLAPGTAVIPSSSPDQNIDRRSLAIKGNDDDIDAGPDLKRPRLSIILDDDDDSYLLPPVRSEDPLEEDNFTQRSVEFPRRAVSEQPGRLSRGSFGSIRTSDRYGDIGLDLATADAYGLDSSFVQQEVYDDFGSDEGGEQLVIQGDTTEELRYPLFNDAVGRSSPVSGRISDVRLDALLGDDAENTFVLNVPQRDSLPARTSLLDAMVGHSKDVDSEVEPEDVDDVDVEEENEEEEEQEERELDDGTESDQDIDPEPLTTHERDHTSTNASVNMRHTTEVDQISHYFSGRSRRKKRDIKVSKYGIQYPSLPVGVVKRLATTFLRTSGNSKTKLSKDTLDAILQASDWFLEQASDDLGTYSQHAGRKTIDESDVLTLMKRCVIRDVYLHNTDTNNMTQTTPDKCYNNPICSCTKVFTS